MNKLNILTNIIINQIIPNYNRYEELGFTIYLESNHINIKYKNNNYILKIKNNLSWNLYYQNKLLKVFKENNFNIVIDYLQEIN